jgi:hypothetical protein
VYSHRNNPSPPHLNGNPPQLCLGNSTNVPASFSAGTQLRFAFSGEPNYVSPFLIRSGGGGRGVRGCGFCFAVSNVTFQRKSFDKCRCVFFLSSFFFNYTTSFLLRPLYWSRVATAADFSHERLCRQLFEMPLSRQTRFPPLLPMGLTLACYCLPSTLFQQSDRPEELLKNRAALSSTFREEIVSSHSISELTWLHKFPSLGIPNF